MLHFLCPVWEGKHKTGRARCDKAYTWMENLFQLLPSTTQMVSLCSCARTSFSKTNRVVFAGMLFKLTNRVVGKG